MRATRLRPVFVDAVPAALDEGILYISLPYRTMSHLCACGCGRRVATPIRPAPRGWAFSYDGENASVRPSVGLVKLPCKSHYIIDRGRVIWLPIEDEADIELKRSGSAPNSSTRRSWWQRVAGRAS